MFKICLRKQTIGLPWGPVADFSSQVALVVKNPPANEGGARDSDSISGSGRFPEVRRSNPLKYSCLENSMDRGSLWATVHGVTESDTTEHACVKYEQSIAGSGGSIPGWGAKILHNL